MQIFHHSRATQQLFHDEQWQCDDCCVQIFNQGPHEPQWVLCDYCELSQAHFSLATPSNKVYQLSASHCLILGHSGHTTSVVHQW